MSFFVTYIVFIIKNVVLNLYEIMNNIINNMNVNVATILHYARFYSLNKFEIRSANLCLVEISLIDNLTLFLFNASVKHFRARTNSCQK